MTSERVAASGEREGRTFPGRCGFKTVWLALDVRFRARAAHGLPLAARRNPLAARHLRLASLFTLVVLAASACHKAAEVPVYVVTPETFVRRVTAEGNLKATTSTPISVPLQADMPLQIAWLAEEGIFLHKDDLIVRFDATTFSNALVQAHGNRGTADNKLQHSTIDSTTTKTNLQRDAKQAEEELTAAKHFRSDDAEIFSRYQQIESQLDEALAGEKRNHAQNVLGVREQLSKADRELIGIEAKKADLDISNAEKGLKSLEVRAPHDGILVLQRDWRGDVPRVGATKWSGSPIGEIPDLSSMNAEVFVLEADAAGLNLGQKAMITLEAVPGKKFSGTIVGVDKLARPRLRGVPVQYFGVTVKLDKTEPKVMKPGARVLAQLELENRNNAISIPRQAVFDKRGQKIVYVRRGDRFVPSAVTIATSSPGRVVVTKGVSKGDALALTDPTEVKS